MDREALREQVREVLLAKLPPAPPPTRRDASGTQASQAPADVVSWRRFDDTRQSGGRALVTEADVTRARFGAKVLAVPQGAIVTPLARETAERLGVKLEAAAAQAGPAPAAAPAAPARVVALAADHGGFALKQALKAFLEALGWKVADLGTKDASPVDYPDFAHAVATAVTGGRAAVGIVIDGVGVGSAMAVNRHRGARAAPCSNTLQAQSAREHNDANVLTLGGRHLGEDAAKAIVQTFLETGFAGGRHAPRVAKIEVP